MEILEGALEPYYKIELVSALKNNLEYVKKYSNGLYRINSVAEILAYNTI